MLVLLIVLLGMAVFGILVVICNKVDPQDGRMPAAPQRREGKH